MTTQTSLLRLILPVQGEFSGTWGDQVNAGLTNLIDSAVAGTTTLNTDADVTLTANNYAADQARAAILFCTGTRTAVRSILAPNSSKIYVVINTTSQGTTLKGVTGPTTGVTIPATSAAICAWNGSDFIVVAQNNLSSNHLGQLTVANGGTGASTLTGLVKGNGTSAFTAAVSGTDYAPATSGSSILYGNGAGGFSNATIGSGISFAGGTLSATGSGGTVTAVSVASANGLAGTSSGGATPALTLSTSVNGVVKGNGTAFSAAVSGTDYQAPIGTISGIAKGNGANALTAATAGTDYLAPPSGTSILKANSGGALANATTADVVAALGTLTANNVLLGNGTSTLQVVAPGTSGNVLTSNGTTWTSAAVSGGITYATPVNVAGQSTVNFTGIPSTAKRIYIQGTGLYDGAGLDINVRIGNGSYQTSGYSTLYTVLDYATNTISGSGIINTFLWAGKNSPTATGGAGNFQATLVNGGNGTWLFTSSCNAYAVGLSYISNGQHALGAGITQLQVYCGGWTAGYITVSWE